MILLAILFEWRLVLRFLQCSAIILVAVLILGAPMLGWFTQPWSPWWFTGNTTAEPGQVPPGAVIPPQGPLLSDSTPLLAAIQPWMGTPYLFGGNTQRGVDCSGFTLAILQRLGYSFPWRTAQTQYDHVDLQTTPQPGDLVFFRRTYQSPDLITHVGFYVGDGMMISAAEPSVGRQSLGSPFWASHFAGYGRPRR